MSNNFRPSVDNSGKSFFSEYVTLHEKKSEFSTKLSANSSWTQRGEAVYCEKYYNSCSPCISGQKARQVPPFLSAQDAQQRVAQVGEEEREGGRSQRGQPTRPGRQLSKPLCPHSLSRCRHRSHNMLLPFNFLCVCSLVYFRKQTQTSPKKEKNNRIFLCKKLSNWLSVLRMKEEGNSAIRDSLLA